MSVRDSLFYLWSMLRYIHFLLSNPSNRKTQYDISQKKDSAENHQQQPSCCKNYCYRAATHLGRKVWVMLVWWQRLKPNYDLSLDPHSTAWRCFKMLKQHWWYSAFRVKCIFVYCSTCSTLLYSGMFSNVFNLHAALLLCHLILYCHQFPTACRHAGGPPAS